MNTPTMSLHTRLAGIVAALLLLLLGSTLPAGAQGSLTLKFESPFFVVNTGANEARVNYVDNILLSPASAELSCTPGVGKFPRGATKVDCTASLGGQTKRGSFYVLVAKGDDTDIALGPITQDPSPVQPAGFVTYNVEYRPTFSSTANIVEISTTLPAHVVPRSVSSPNCEIEGKTVICVFFSISEPGSFQLEVQTRAPFQGDYAVSWSARMLPNDAGKTQLDLFAGNNTASITTEVRVAQAPNKLFLPLLRQ